MKIFVTVGTTPFDNLINSINQINSKKYQFIIQTGNSDITVTNHQHFKWTEDIEKYFNWADLIICHAGAGTIYNLLEMNKPIIVVPNLDRTDHHQKEIANYVKKNNLGLTCFDLDLLFEQIDLVENVTFSKYRKEPFFSRQLIINFIKKRL